MQDSVGILKEYLVVPQPFIDGIYVVASIHVCVQQNTNLALTHSPCSNYVFGYLENMTDNKMAGSFPLMSGFTQMTGVNILEQDLLSD